MTTITHKPVPSERCIIPPEGWWCSRQRGHDGPCAARACNPVQTLCDQLRQRFDDEPDFLGIEASHWMEMAGEAIQRIHRYALAAEGAGYDLILSVTEPIIFDGALRTRAAAERLNAESGE